MLALLLCGQKNCPYIKDGKDYKELRKATQSGNMGLAKKIYLQRFAQFRGSMRGTLAESLKKDREAAVKASVKFTADFYKEVFNVYGEKAEQLAKALADQAKGKKIRNAGDAAKAWEKHKANINKKINAKDRAAIEKWLESVDVKVAAQNFKRFSKSMGITSKAIDAVDWANELIKAAKTDNWRPFFVKTEAIATGMAATYLIALAFSVLLGNPIGLVWYGLIMAGIGYAIDDEFVEKSNQFWGI